MYFLFVIRVVNLIDCCTGMCWYGVGLILLGHHMWCQVDVLFMDETFKLAPIGSRAPEDTQFIFVTATLPQVQPSPVQYLQHHNACTC